MNKDIARVISSIKRTGSKKGSRTSTDIFLANGKIQVLDGIRVLRTEEPGFEPETERELYKTENFYPKDYSDEILESPTYSELKSMRDNEKMKYRMKTGKRFCDKRVVYKFKNGYVLNIDYLMDGIKATGSTKFTWYGNCRPCLFKSEDEKTDYLLCPIASNNDSPVYGVMLV